MSWSNEAVRRLWPRPLAVAAVLFSVLLPAQPAAAHAVLVESQPANGAVVAQAPQVVLLRFSEDISARLSSASLLDGNGHLVAGSRIAADRGGRRLLALGLPALDPGTYGVAWRAFTQDDGHTTGGVVVFTVDGTAGPPGTAALFTEEPGGPRPLDVTLRWLGLCLLAVLIGGLAFARVVLRPITTAAAGQPLSAAADKARLRVLAFAGRAGVLAAVVGVAELAASGTRLATTILIHTRWGHLWLGREAALVALAAVAVALRGRLPHRREPALWLAAAVLVTATVAVEALGSHAMAVESARTAAVLAVAAHTLTACLWLGGVAALAAVIAPRGEPTAGRGLLLRACRGRFAALAGVSVGLVVVTGLYSAGRQVGPAHALVDTAYGRALLVKGVLLAVLGGLGLANAARLRVPAAARPAGSRSRRLLATEAGVGIVLLLVAGLLVESPPSRVSTVSQAGAPSVVTRTGSVADLAVSVSVSPNRPGANGFTILAASGRRPEPAPIEGVTLELAGADPVTLREIEPGRYFGIGTVASPGLVRATATVQRSGANLAVPVEWSVAPATAAPARPRDSLAPMVNGLALLVIVVMVATAARWLVVTRRRSSRGSRRTFDVDRGTRHPGDDLAGAHGRTGGRVGTG
jgi:copper transport protein